MEILVATNNKKKLREINDILAGLVPDLKLLCLSDIGFHDDIIEDADTYEGNALIKTNALSSYGYITIADDSGLSVDYLDGAPGVYSARYAGEGHDDAQNNKKLLEALKGLPNEKRTARYVSAVAVVFPDGKEFTVRGTTEGYIADHEEGSNGFGYDPLFVGELGCFGLLSDSDKDSISHRGRALKKMAEELNKYI